MIQKLQKYPHLVLLVILLFFVFGSSGSSVPLTGDQKVYLSIAQEMWEKGNWLIPSLFGEPNFLKPPLQYWATLAGWNLFGISVFGSVIPSVLALIACAWGVLEIAKQLQSRSPLVAALLFSGTLGTMTYGTTAQMEIWIVAFYLMAWMAVLKNHLFTSFLLTGTMAWIKGPLYPVIWTLGIVFWKFDFLKTSKFWLSLLSGMSLGLSWYFLASLEHYEEMIRQFFYVENFGKIATSQGSPWGLWFEFLGSLFPWVLILIPAMGNNRVLRKWKQHAKFYLSYGLIGAVFFTFFPYRVNTYLYFLTPIMAILVAEVDFNFSRNWKITLTGVYSILFTVLSVLLYRLYESEWIEASVFLGFISVFVMFLVSMVNQKPIHFSISCLILVNLIRISAIQIGEKDWNGLRQFTDQHKGSVAYWMPERDIWHEFGLVSTVIQKPVARIDDPSHLDSYLKSGGAVIVDDSAVSFPASGYSCINWQRLKRRTKFPWKRMIGSGLSWGDDEITRNFRICTR